VQVEQYFIFGRMRRPISATTLTLYTTLDRSNRGVEIFVEYLRANPRHAIDEKEFGTNSVQLRERKNGPLVPKRHQMKHLDFLIILLESRCSRL
jgi:hypothetical protein